MQLAVLTLHSVKNLSIIYKQSFIYTILNPWIQPIILLYYLLLKISMYK